MSAAIYSYHSRSAVWKVVEPSRTLKKTKTQVAQINWWRWPNLPNGTKRTSFIFYLQGLYFQHGMSVTKLYKMLPSLNSVISFCSNKGNLMIPVDLFVIFTQFLQTEQFKLGMFLSHHFCCVKTFLIFLSLIEQSVINAAHSDSYC